MELWETTKPKVHALQRRSCGLLDLRVYFNAFASFSWFVNRLKQTQTHYLTSSAFHSNGRSLKNFLEGLEYKKGRPESQHQGCQVQLWFYKHKALGRIPEAKSLDNREHKLWKDQDLGKQRKCREQSSNQRNTIQEHFNKTCSVSSWLGEKSQPTMNCKVSQLVCKME